MRPRYSIAIVIPTEPLRVNAAGYRQDYEQIQVIQTTPTPSGAFDIAVANGGSAKVYGGALETTSVAVISVVRHITTSRSRPIVRVP